MHTGEISTQVVCNAACVQGNAPVNVKEKCVFVQAIKRGHGYECVYVCVIIKQISSTQQLVCVYVMEALLKVL